MIDGPGNDIFVKEVGFAQELADIFVSSDGVEFVFLGRANGGGTTELDLATIGFDEPVTAIRVVGLDSGGGSPGFDLLGIQVLPGSIGGGDGGYVIQLRDNETVTDIDFANLEIESAVNQAPVFDSAPQTEAVVTELYRYNAQATDFENERLTYSLLNGPSGLTISPTTGTVVWLPSSEQVGIHLSLIHI